MPCLEGLGLNLHLVKLLRGRTFTSDDDAMHPKAAIINHALARKYFPGEDPVGKRVGNLDLKPDSMKTIVGVVDDFREGALYWVRSVVAHIWICG